MYNNKLCIGCKRGEICFIVHDDVSVHNLNGNPQMAAGFGSLKQRKSQPLGTVIPGPVSLSALLCLVKFYPPLFPKFSGGFA